MREDGTDASRGERGPFAARAYVAAFDWLCGWTVTGPLVFVYAKCLERLYPETAAEREARLRRRKEERRRNDLEFAADALEAEPDVTWIEQVGEPTLTSSCWRQVGSHALAAELRSAAGRLYPEAEDEAV